MPDKFNQFDKDNTVENYFGPVRQAFAVTPHNTNDLSQITRAVYLGASGDLNVLLVGDSTPVVFKGLAAGVFHPMRAQKILVTSTTAADILGLV